MKIKIYSDYLEKTIELTGEIIKKELERQGESETRYHISDGLHSTRKYWYEVYDITFKTLDNKIVHFKQQIRTWQSGEQEEFMNRYFSETVSIFKDSNNEEYEVYVEMILIELGLVKYDFIDDRGAELLKKYKKEVV